MFDFWRKKKTTLAPPQKIEMEFGPVIGRYQDHDIYEYVVVNEYRFYFSRLFVPASHLNVANNFGIKKGEILILDLKQIYTLA